ncbi:TetR/AcrR family transcriptional regulator [Micromonospora rosaria]|nr:TetR/AcrR family transcriptional regulator [Micromonospora rosaria]
MSDGAPAERRERGRTRDAAATASILNAAMSILVEKGLAGFTIEGIAARAGVGKATIYRWWPSRGAVALDAFLDAVQPLVPYPEDEDFPTQLRVQVTALVRVFRDHEVGGVVRALMGEAQTDPDLAAAFRDRWLEARRTVGRAVFREAQRTGQIRDDLDIETAIDLVYGAVYFRLLAGHQPLSDEFVGDLVDYAVRGLAPSST